MIRAIILFACVAAALGFGHEAVVSGGTADGSHFVCSGSYNFVTGVSYSQTVMDDDDQAENCADNLPQGCTGFFFQEHGNGHKICGYYTSDPLYNTQMVIHGHELGSTVCVATDMFVCSNPIGGVNFITGTPYTQTDMPGDSTADDCKPRCRWEDGCVGFFFQEHGNGHKICGFYHWHDSTIESLSDQGVSHGHQDGSQVCFDSYPFGCTDKYNFVSGPAYRQIDINEFQNDISMVEHCGELCLEDHDCYGFFVQRHQGNDHRICAMYQEEMLGGDFVSHGHAFGRVCMLGLDPWMTHPDSWADDYYYYYGW